MEFSWQIVIDAGAISLALLVATLLRAKVRFFQKYLIPNALVAGVILLPVYNYLLPVLGQGQHKLGDLVYHLLNISFIAMSLRSSPPKIKGHKGGGVLGMSTGIITGYAGQALLGLGITLLFIGKLFPSFGLFLPLGFALGPGQAYAIGKGWEAMGFEGASSVGLTFAALGYLWACFGGLYLIYMGIRKGWVKGESLTALKDRSILTGVVPKGTEKPVGARLSTDNEAIDSFSFHTAAVIFTYFLSFLLLKLVTWLLSFAGNAGIELATNLWGINFIFSALTALLVRRIVDGIKLGYVLDDPTLSRLSGLSVDFMLAGSIAAISLVFVTKFWLEILIITTICGIVTLIMVPWMGSRMFHDNRFERMVMIYGVSTGTLSTGLALLRVIDPEFKTPVASDYMLSAGLTFVIVIPFILSINLPAYAATKGNMLYFWAMIGVSAAYLVYAVITYIILARKRAFAKIGKLWI